MAARFVQTGGHRKAVRSVKSAAVDTLRGWAAEDDVPVAALYRLWSIGDRHPAMLRVASGGAAIAVEVWSVPAAGLADILAKEPPGLCIGKVRLDDDSEVLGVLGEPILCEGQREITAHGGWRAYLTARRG